MQRGRRSTRSPVFSGSINPLQHVYTTFERTVEPGWGGDSELIRAGGSSKTGAQRGCDRAPEEPLRRSVEAYVECCRNPRAPLRYGWPRRGAGWRRRRSRGWAARGGGEVAASGPPPSSSRPSRTSPCSCSRSGSRTRRERSWTRHSATSRSPCARASSSASPSRARREDLPHDEALREACLASVRRQ